MDRNYLRVHKPMAAGMEVWNGGWAFDAPPPQTFPAASLLSSPPGGAGLSTIPHALGVGGGYACRLSDIADVAWGA